MVPGIELCNPGIELCNPGIELCKYFRILVGRWGEGVTTEGACRAAQEIAKTAEFCPNKPRTGLSGAPIAKIER